MPVIQVYAFHGRSNDQKRRLVKLLTNGLCETFDVLPEEVTVVIVDPPKENWANGGVLAIDRN